MSDHDRLDTTALGEATLALLGEVNYTWAQLDLVSSAAFASLLKVDPVELGITLGRTEIQAKIKKMYTIARHRRDKALSSVLAAVKQELAQLRPMRNAITHGAYIGKSGLGEICFTLPAEFIVDDGEDTAVGLFVCTVPELRQHIVDITKVATKLLAEFGTPEMRKLFDLPARVRP